MSLRETRGRHPVRCAAALLAIGLGCVATGDAPASRSASGATTRDVGDPPMRRALLIGVNDYQALPALRGAVNDVELMRELLSQRYGFAETQIRVLRDAEATRAGILAALEQLVAESGPNDLVYFHFSGHGSQVPDTSGDEVDDERDETLVPQDGRTEGIPDITDDELDAIFARLRARHALIVLDSCHSGSATRGSLAVRAVPLDPRPLYGSRLRAVVPLTSERFVLLTAAAAHEEALDGTVDGKPHGVFTYSFGRSLGAAANGEPALAVLARVEEHLTRLEGQIGVRDMPEPQLEGPPELFAQALLPATDSEPATEDSAEARLPWALVRPGGVGSLRLVEAVPLGGVPGATWAVYAPGEREFSPGAALATAVVTGIEGRDALARPEPAGTEVPEDARAVLVAPPLVVGRVPVRWLAAPSEGRERVEGRVRELLRSVDFVSEGQFARFLLEWNGDRCEVFGADGRSSVAVLGAEDEAVLAASLAGVFARSITAAELLALDNPTSQMRLDLRVAGDPRPAPEASPAASGPAPVYRIRREGDPRNDENSLQLAVTSSADCYLSIVDLDAEGRVQLLFPNELSEARGYLPGGLVRGGATVSIPDSLSPSNRAGFHLDYSPPAGTDTIRAFCMADPAVARGLREQIAAAETPAVRSGGTPPRPKLSGVRGLLDGVTTRGVVIAAAEGSAPEQSVAADWTAATLQVDVADAASAPPALGLDYVESPRFDKALSTAMATEIPEVEVRFVAPVTPNQLPPRLDRWLAEASESGGGQVELAPDPELHQRSLVAEILPLVLDTIHIVRAHFLYRHARHYDAVVYYRPDAGTLTRVVWSRRMDERRGR